MMHNLFTLENLHDNKEIFDAISTLLKYKKVLSERLEKATDKYLEESAALVEQLGEEEENKVSLETTIIAKSVELVALLSQEEQDQIKHTLGVWELTGLMNGEEINKAKTVVNIDIGDEDE